MIQLIKEKLNKATIEVLQEDTPFWLNIEDIDQNEDFFKDNSCSIYGEVNPDVSIEEPYVIIGEQKIKFTNNILVRIYKEYLKEIISNYYD